MVLNHRLRLIQDGPVDGANLRIAQMGQDEMGDAVTVAERLYQFRALGCNYFEEVVV